MLTLWLYTKRIQCALWKVSRFCSFCHTLYIASLIDTAIAIISIHFIQMKCIQSNAISMAFVIRDATVRILFPHMLHIAFISYRGCSCNDVYNTRRLDNVLGHEQMVSNWGENYLYVANCRNFSFMCIQFNSFRLWKRIPIVVNSIVYRQLSNNRNIICFAVKSVNFTYRKCSIKLALE